MVLKEEYIMHPKWILRNRALDYERITRKFNIDPIVAKVIRNRDIETDEEFEMYLNGGIGECHDPLLLDGMDEGTELMIRKLEEGSSIRIIGDYDVDGVTATFILLKGLSDLGAKVDYRIPHRITDGYGMNVRLISEALADDIDTVITCDNGIAAFDAIELAKQQGMTVIVTDHHEPKERRVLADIVIDQKLETNDYPYEDICGATIAFKFIKCLYRKLGKEFDEKYFIPFVAIATVCDVMQLKDESRIFVKEGLRLIKNSENTGLRALISATGRDGKEISATSIGFIFGPCINSAGRVESAEQAVELFKCQDAEKAAKMAQHLVELNESRKSICEAGVKKAQETIESREDILKDNVIVIYIPELHESLAGIVAAKLKEKYYKPAIVFADSELDPGLYKGSARGIDGYDLATELEKVSSLLSTCGGHKKAAGVSLRKENLDAFRIAINENECIAAEDLVPKMVIDAKVPMSYFNLTNVEQLQVLEPVGEGNPEPTFADAGLKVVKAEIKGKLRNCLWLFVQDATGRKYRLLSFDVEGFFNNIKEWFGDAECGKIESGAENSVVLNIAYRPQVNEFMGTRDVQFMIVDYQKS